MKHICTFKSILLALGLLPLSAVAGTWSFTDLNSDADTGISPSKRYTHLIDLGHDPEPATINGVRFDKSRPTRFARYTLWVAGDIFQGHSGSGFFEAAGKRGLGDLFSDFLYSGVTADGKGGIQKLTLTGLYPGETYRLSLFVNGWGAAWQEYTVSDAPGGPFPRITRDGQRWIPDPSTSMTEVLTGAGGQAAMINYDYVAPANGTLVVTMDSLNDGDSFHFFGFMNEAISVPLDSDGDGMPDAYENLNGLNPAVNDAAGDLDNDGLTNLDEYTVGTDPRNSDTDGDGLLDGVETNTGIYVSASDTGTDPLSPAHDWHKIQPHDVYYDFCSGSLGTWTATGGFGVTPKQRASKECDFHVESSVIGGTTATGTLRSPNFTVNFPVLCILGNGYNANTGGRTNLYRLRRVSDNAILRTASPPNTDEIKLVIMDVQAFNGQSVYFEVFDGDNNGAATAWIGLNKLWSFNYPPTELKWRQREFAIHLGWPTVNFVAAGERINYLQRLRDLKINMPMMENEVFSLTPAFEEPNGMKAMFYANPSPPDRVYKWRNHPSTTSYFHYDEPASGTYPTVSNYTWLARIADPTKPSYHNLASINHGISRNDVINYFNIVKPEMFSFDFYTWCGWSETLVENLAFFAPLCRDNGNIPLWSWENAFACSGTGASPDATNRRRLRYSIYLNLIYGVKGISWFTASDIFNNASGQSGVINKPGAYTDLQGINDQLLKVGPEMVRLSSTAVYHTGIGTVARGDHAPSMQSIPSGHWIQIPTGKISLGMFTNPQGADYAMVMNRETASDAAIATTLEFANLASTNRVTKVRWLDPTNGIWSDLPISGAHPNQSVSLSIIGGQGYLLKITRGGVEMQPDTLTRPAGVGVKVTDATLLANDVDSQNVGLVLAGVSPSSAQGGTVTRSGGWVHYTPPGSDPATDTFTYTASNGQSSETDTVTVNRSPADTDSTLTITGMVTNGNGSVTISFVGIPNQTYVIQAATNQMSPVWVPIGTNVAGLNSLFQFTDVNAPTYPTRIYRTALP